MKSAAANIADNVRLLRPADLERIVAIDSSHVGAPRRHFFEKRLSHATQHPEDFVQIGVTRDDSLVGFAFARILRGEFGREHAIGTIDAISVEQHSRERGVGRALMDGLTKIMREKAVQSLQSEADWTNHDVLKFFDASGFRIAPRLALERSVLTPLTEPIEDE